MVSESQPGEFTIEDLFDVIFPDNSVTGHLCMVYHSFLDDSKDRDQSKLFVSAGFFGTKDDWATLRPAWNKRLNQDGIQYWKSSEYNRLEKQFSVFRKEPPPLGRQKARKLRSDLQEILRNIPGIQGLGVCMPMDAYAKVATRPEAKLFFNDDTKYRRVLESILFETVKMVQKKPGRNMVAFVHDDESDFDILHRYYREFRQHNKKTAKWLGGFAPLSDKDHPSLQAADMAANFSLERGLEFMETQTRLLLIEEMQGNLQRLAVWDERYMLSVLKRNLIANGMSIPQDLQSSEYD